MLRAEGRTLLDIATDARRREVVGLALGARRPVRAAGPPAVGRSSPAPPAPRQARRDRGVRSPGPCERIGALSDDAFLAAGAALYAGEGAKRDGKVTFANTNPAMVAFFCAWLRRFFAIDESRLRVRVYLHEGLDLDAAERFWSEVTGDPCDAVQRARTGRRPIRRSGGTSTSTAAATSTTAARGRTERSWGWSGRC